MSYQPGFNYFLVGDCPVLSDPTNGRVTVTGQGLGHNATYTCAAGYELNAGAGRRCELVGSVSSWTVPEPMCIRK